MASRTARRSYWRYPPPKHKRIQPADLTQALAKGARDRGAEIYRNTTVTSMGY